MTKAVTPSDFLPRSTIEMSKEQRQALVEIEWDAFTAPQYQHLRSTNAVGEWHIGHPPEHDPVKISYTAPMSEGEEYEDVFEKMQALKAQGLYVEDIEWMAEHYKIAQTEIGYAIDQDAAKAFIELARRHEPGQSSEDVLVGGGFKFDYDLGPRTPGGPSRFVYRKEDERKGGFTVFYSPGHDVHLVHEKNGAKSWENLLRLSLYSEAMNGFLTPHPMSPEIADPLGAACEMAVHLSNTWRPQYRASSKKKASP